MPKKYINVRNSLRQHEVDNWLLMLPATQLSSDAKIIFLILKKIQAHDLTCMTDAQSWYRISGLRFMRVKECLAELQEFGLVELYHSTSIVNRQAKINTFTAYLLDHYLMKGCYETRDCPHDNDSFPKPECPDNVLRNSHVAQTMKSFKEQVKGNFNDSHEANPSVKAVT